MNVEKLLFNVVNFGKGSVVAQVERTGLVFPLKDGLRILVAEVRFSDSHKTSVVEDIDEALKSGDIIRIGRRRFWIFEQSQDTRHS